jgi:hypothetical protein
MPTIRNPALPGKRPLEHHCRTRYCARLFGVEAFDMRTVATTFRAGCLAVLLTAGVAVRADAEHPDSNAEAAEAAAIAVMHAFLAAFNDRDAEAWADTLLFPHVRLASGDVLVYPDRAAFVAAMDLQAFAAATGWDRSTWDDMRVVQASPDKVHIAVTFTRFDADGARLASYHSLYVIEQRDGRWGVRARSSFAP